MRDEIANDPVLRPFVESVSALPARDPALVARVLAATATPPPRPWWMRWRTSLAVLATAAVVLTVVARRGPVAPSTVAMAPTAAAPLPATAATPGPDTSPAVRAVTADGSLPASVPATFTLDAPTAQTVQLVGDFNAWDPTAAALTRTADGRWTITLPVAPGRHVYAFVVDGAWMADPRAPRAPDDDFGHAGSVRLVPAP